MEWLVERDADSPASLRQDVRDAVARTPDAGDTAATLTAAAIACLDEALTIGGRRAAASPLLAADALLTWAAEAAAENGSSLAPLATDTATLLAALIEE